MKANLMSIFSIPSYENLRNEFMKTYQNKLFKFIFLHPPIIVYTKWIKVVKLSLKRQVYNKNNQNFTLLRKFKENKLLCLEISH